MPHPTPVSASRVHLAYLDGLRALAALYVVVFHIRGYYQYILGTSAQKVTLPLSFGSFAVGVFIVLSGFCLMLPVARSEDGLLRGGAKRFFLSRARRILPPYYAAIAFSLVLIALAIGHKTGTFWDASVPVTRRGLLSHLVMLQDISHATWGQIDSPLWSISVEWRIYFCFPLLVLLWRRIGPWVTTAITVAASYGLVYAFRHVPLLMGLNSQENGISPQYLALFGLGMLAAGIAFSRHAQLAALRTKISWNWVASLTLAALVVATTRIPLTDGGRPLLDLFVGLFAACLLVAASQAGLLQRALSWKPLVFVGTFAYSLYLIHFPILQIVWQYLVHPLHLHASASLCLHWLIALPLSVAIAYGFHLVCERPFMSKPAPKTERQAEAAAIASPAP